MAVQEGLTVQGTLKFKMNTKTRPEDPAELPVLWTGEKSLWQMGHAKINIINNYISSKTMKIKKIAGEFTLNIGYIRKIL